MTETNLAKGRGKMFSICITPSVVAWGRHFNQLLWMLGKLTACTLEVNISVEM